ncbi:MAG: ThuA domain-containing protein [Clostridia bacterium]|nr:ThuA domain-containing protein [Clostridia bacterium]
MIRVLVFNEFCHERAEERIREVYPNGIHGAIADFLGKEEDFSVKTVTLDEVESITPALLAETDVLIWWAHMRHGNVPDEVAYMIRDAVLSGMGAIFLHSGHHSKPFRYLLGTSCDLTWRESDDEEILWVIEPSHPITRGIDRAIILPAEETYGEPFVIPTPDKLLFIGHFAGGEVFRSGCLYERGNGKIFYFQPGHESYPTYYNEQVQTVVKNAVRYLAPAYRCPSACPQVRHIKDEQYVMHAQSEF